MFKRMLIDNTKEGRLFKAGAVGILLMLAVSVVIFMATVCMAADAVAIPVEQSGWMVATQEILNKVVFPAIEGLMLAAIGLVIHRLQQKYKLDILTGNQELIEKAALQGISLAEEKAAQYAAGKIGGDAKLQYAIEHVQSIIPTITTDQARNVIEGMLARIPGVGATKETAIAVQ